MRELLHALFDPESLNDERDRKSSIRRGVLIQLILIAIVILVGFIFASFKNTVGRDYCIAVLGILGASATGTAWLGQSKSKAVLTAQAQNGIPITPESQPNGIFIPNSNPMPITQNPPESLEVKKKNNKKTIASILRTIAIVTSNEEKISRIPPQYPMPLLSKKSPHSAVQSLTNCLMKKYKINEDKND